MTETRAEIEALRDVQQAAREYMIGLNTADETDEDNAILIDLLTALFEAVERADALL